MSNTIQFVRCRFISDTSGLECEETFPVFEGDSGRLLCDLHKNIISPTLAAELNENKSQYVAHRNEHAAFCAHMTLNELDRHVADLDEKIEKLKSHYFAARGVRQSKLADLSEDESRERQKIKVIRKETIGPVKPKRVSVKADPVRALMQTGMSEKAARSVLGLPDIFSRADVEN